MGYKHSRDEILEAAVAVARSDGMHALTFQRVAAALGISDRMVVYYFPSKSELVAAVLMALGDRLRVTLAPTVAHACDGPLDFVRVAWPVLASGESDAEFALYFEALGLAVSGREPYRSLAPLLVDGWIEWTSTVFRGPAARRRANAETAIAIVDGLLLLRHTTGADVADRAARSLLGS